MMTPEQFCYWLQGYMELQNPVTIDETKTEMIKEHLNLVFNKVTKSKEEITIELNNNHLFCKDFSNQKLC